MGRGFSQTTSSGAETDSNFLDAKGVGVTRPFGRRQLRMRSSSSVCLSVCYGALRWLVETRTVDTLIVTVHDKASDRPSPQWMR